MHPAVGRLWAGVVDRVDRSPDSDSAGVLVRIEEKYVRRVDGVRVGAGTLVESFAIRAPGRATVDVAPPARLAGAVSDVGTDVAAREGRAPRATTGSRHGPLLVRIGSSRSV